jgi:hypothetical protein
MSISPHSAPAAYTTPPVIATTQYHSTILNRMVPTSNRHTAFSSYGRTRVMQLGEHVEITDTVRYFILNCVGVDVEIEKTNRGYAIRVDVVTGTAVNVNIGMAGQDMTITKSSNIQTFRPIFQLICTQQKNCNAIIRKTEKKILSHAIQSLFPESQFVWGASVAAGSIVLCGKHTRGGWCCNGCGVEFSCIGDLTNHLNAPKHLKFKRVSRDGRVDGTCVGPPTTHQRPADRWAYAVNPNALRGALNTLKKKRTQRTAIHRLSLRPKW